MNRCIAKKMRGKMKLTTTSIMFLLFFSALPSLAVETDQSTNIQITVENSSLKKSYFEVKDSICAESIPNECKIAEIIAKSDKCKNPKWAEECAKSKEIVDSAECVEGIVFNGWLESGGNVQLNICTDHTGNGRVSTRNSQTAPWTTYNWVEAGKTISIK
jgi:hypothetical protein